MTSKKESLRNELITSGYDIIQDTDDGFVIRKKFNGLSFMLWLFLTGIGGIIYVAYHFGKKKEIRKYK